MYSENVLLMLLFSFCLLILFFGALSSIFTQRSDEKSLSPNASFTKSSEQPARVETQSDQGWSSTVKNIHRVKEDTKSPVTLHRIKNNAGLYLSYPTLDLHDYKAREAKHEARQFLRRNSGRQVEIITGRGVHSIGGVSVLKTVMEEVLEEMDLTYTLQNKGGSYLIDNY